jgi:hypothetical protein
MILRYLRAFGRFWYDFLVGDRPELFLGPIVALAITWLLVQLGTTDLLVAGILVAMVLLVASGSLVFALRK